MARTALGSVRYANTRRLPPHQAQVKTSNANVLRSSFAQSSRGIRSFFGSLLTTASGATLAPSSPAWGSAFSRAAVLSCSLRQMLSALSERHQVIAFTCHPWLRELFKAEGARVVALAHGEPRASAAPRTTGR
jgi:hypothetical protein